MKNNTCKIVHEKWYMENFRILVKWGFDSHPGVFFFGPKFFKMCLLFDVPVSLIWEFLMASAIACRRLRPRAGWRPYFVSPNPLKRLRDSHGVSKTYFFFFFNIRIFFSFILGKKNNVIPQRKTYTQFFTAKDNHPISEKNINALCIKTTFPKKI